MKEGAGADLGIRTGPGARASERNANGLKEDVQDGAEAVATEAVPGRHREVSLVVATPDLVGTSR